MNSLKILNTKPIQENFMGLNAVYHGYAGISDFRGYVFNEEQCILEADRAKDLGIKIARTLYDFWGYDEEKNEWTWNTPDFNAFCKWVERMKERNIDIALNIPWCHLGEINGTSWRKKFPGADPDDLDKSLEKFSVFASETLHQLIEVRGFTNVKYIVYTTEPNNLLNESVLEKYNMSTFDAWLKIGKAIHDRLVLDGRRKYVKIIGPNATDGNYCPEFLDYLTEKNPEWLDIYSSHCYIWGRFYDTKKVSPALGTHLFVTSGGGRRIHQYVDLKPNTEYEFSLCIRLEATELEKISGYITFGAFRASSITQLGKNFSVNYNGVTTRLGRYTTKMIEASHLPTQWERISMTFKTEENLDDAVVGFFDNVESANKHNEYITGFSLKEVGKDTELIKNGNLTDYKDWVFGPSNSGVPQDVFDKTKYEFWTQKINMFLEHCPKNKPFCFDEYNRVVGYRLKDYKGREEARHGTDLSIARVAFMNAGLEHSFMWTLFDQQWPNCKGGGLFDENGVHKCGVTPCPMRDERTYPSYNAVRLTGLLGGGEGTKIYYGEGAKWVHLTMTESPEGDVTVIVVNESEDAQEIEISFEKALDKKLNRYVVDPALVERTAGIPKMEPYTEIEVCDLIKDTLPGGAVAAYTTKVKQ